MGASSLPCLKPVDEQLPRTQTTLTCADAPPAHTGDADDDAGAGPGAHGEERNATLTRTSDEKTTVSRRETDLPHDDDVDAVDESGKNHRGVNPRLRDEKKPFELHAGLSSSDETERRTADDRDPRLVTERRALRLDVREHLEDERGRSRHLRDRAAPQTLGEHRCEPVRHRERRPFGGAHTARHRRT